MATNSTADNSTYITARHRHATVYHSTRECERLRNPEDARDRSEHYVEWHDLDPCEYCHDEGAAECS